MDRFIRSTLRKSRSLDFSSIDELIAQTGHPVEEWPLVVCKELLDNSLDACEEARIPPVLTITIDRSGITVSDNGPGLSTDTITGIVDFSARTSSRYGYMAPDRGRQGNALKTLIAMPLVLDGKRGHVDIFTLGTHHKIVVTLDRIQQQPIVMHETFPDRTVKIGTSIKIAWPISASSTGIPLDNRFLLFASDYCVLNPHLTLTLIHNDTPTEWQAIDQNWTKWTPGQATSPHWYKTEDLIELFALYLYDAHAKNTDRALWDILQEFRGLKGSAKRKTVLDGLGLKRKTLSDLIRKGDFDRRLVERLLTTMQRLSPPVKPMALGVIGENHLRQQVKMMGCNVDTFRYCRQTSKGHQVPWVVEAAFAGSPAVSDRYLITGINWSPTIVNPFRRLNSTNGGLDALLEERRVGHKEPVVLLLHLAYPRLKFTDRGKSAVTLEDEALSAALVAAVTQVTKKWTALRKAEDKDTTREIRRWEKLERSQSTKIKTVAYEVLPTAYEQVSSNGTLPANARQLMYAVRRLIQPLTDRSLDDNYFTQTLLPDYLRDHPERTATWDVVFDARGHLLEPHTERTIPLGTVEVRDYLREIEHHQVDRLSLEVPGAGSFPTCGPLHRYRAILFVEKEGFLPLFKAVHLQERFDLAIMSTKGLSVTAARRLVDTLCTTQNGVPLLVLHDFDKSGFSIVGTLKHSTARHTYRNTVQVIDLGLRLTDVEQYELESERVAMKRPWGTADEENLRANGATAAEITFLSSMRRVELNAFLSEKMVEWIEAKLAEHGIKKVIPDKQIVSDAYQRALETKLLAVRAREIVELIRQQVKGLRVPKTLIRELRRSLDAHPQLSWDQAVSVLVDKHLNQAQSESSENAGAVI